MTLILFLGYPFILYWLRRKGVIKPESFINNISLFVGWLVALFIAWIHLLRNRIDNLAISKQEIKNRLQIEAFRELNRAISKFSNATSDISASYSTLPSKLELHIENTSVFSFNKVEVYRQISEQTTKLYYAHAEFLTSIEANEIVIIQFDHLRKYIFLRIENIKKALENFNSYFLKVNYDSLKKWEERPKFRKRCEEISEQFIEIQCYLFDYRILLMNHLLGEVFETKVPERKPKDSKYKILTEIAKKEDVEKEYEEWEQRVMQGGM